MRGGRWAGAGLALCLLAAAAGGPRLPATGPEVPPGPADPPRLLVLLVVDQLTPDLLERYGPALQGGFRRLREGGRGFQGAVHDHAVTFTSPGHATPVTGVHPSRHGIVSNSWREWWDGEWISVSAVADPDTRTVGGAGPGSSPRTLLRDGLPDWLLEEHPEARIVSISGKSTAAVLMAGRAPGHVYWYSVGGRGFVTSTHYRDELPGWVARFNRESLPGFAGDGCWRSRVPPELATLSRRDTVSYEADGVHTHFPHCVQDQPYRDRFHFISQTPALDAVTLALAREAVEALELGRGEAPDYLALGLSAPDRVGHRFGPYSREQLDNLMRLDDGLDAFLTFLDEAVGRDRYVLALTSDHGVLPLPEYLQERGEPGLRLTTELSDTLWATASRLGIIGTEADPMEIRESPDRLARELERVEWIEAAMPWHVLAGGAPADSFVNLYRRSFHPRRPTFFLAAYGVEVRLAEGVLVRRTGTTHGVPYLHDRAVPLLFYGPGIPPGVSTEPARTVDLAPTLARLAGIPAPPDLDGEPLLGGDP